MPAKSEDDGKQELKLTKYNLDECQLEEIILYGETIEALTFNCKGISFRKEATLLQQHW